MKRNLLALSSIVIIAAMTVHPGTVQAEHPADLGCKMQFSLSTWSIIYKQSEGHGLITCQNGQSMHVKIVARGGGLTAGKSHIDDGTGRFTDVRSMSEILGHYGDAEVHAGAGRASEAQVLTKGEVSLALSGTGEGIDLGIDVGEVTLSQVK
ncbi:MULTISPECIES: hypothetical protein [Dyella]|uniref:hypothetical protein n=1 Tax=Dyella TaxID=231454 RepID=UPI001E37C8C2|nr:MULTISPECIES: hypothetical protein [Dyella]MDR3446713.1 hypothetical protein [Dyella sp.]ULU23414.1 hypothetical protein DYST_00310 [Dyella terrae]